MQMHQIRYFLALCEELSFTRAAKRSGVSQPSLTNAIRALERELGGPLFQRRPLIALTALGHAMQPYLSRIAQTADHAREAAQALVDLPPDNAETLSLHQDTRGPQQAETHGGAIRFKFPARAAMIER
jgi:LysR family transcriptional regulator, hydrogen peroxide-inducible genes activator